MYFQAFLIFSLLNFPLMSQPQFPWLNTTEYPFAHHFFNVSGHRMHYIDEGAGDILLFVHGTPSWSFDFRHVIHQLSPDFRCIAVDHIGFGLSDKPEHYDYSTQNHASTLEKFIIAHDLKNITLVVHDFGGPIALSVAMNHPERIANLVVLNSWLWSSEDDQDYIKLRKILKSPLLPFLYKQLNFSPKYILPKSFGDQPLPKNLLKQYTKPFANSKQRNGALAFAKSLLNDQQWFEELWQKQSLINDKPTLFVWGMKDPVIKPKYLKRFITGFPYSRVVEIGTAGHFPQEEQPLEVASAIKAFVKW